MSSAEDFFKSLYVDQPAGLKGNFDAAVTRLVSKQGENAVVSDQALQSLMMNFVLSNPKNAKKGKELSAVLAGIKQRSVESFVDAFPGISLDDLIAEAEKAGHTVEVLGR